MTAYPISVDGDRMGVIYVTECGTFFCPVDNPAHLAWLSDKPFDSVQDAVSAFVRAVLKSESDG